MENNFDISYLSPRIIGEMFEGRIEMKADVEVCKQCKGEGHYTAEAPDNNGGMTQWKQVCECKIKNGEDDCDMSGADGKGDR